MKLETYIKSERGRQMRLAKAIRAQPQLMYQWANGIRPIPIERCVAIERATGGVVTRRDLRPDDWWKIWPELVGADADSATGIDVVVARPDVDAVAAAVEQEEREREGVR